MTAGFALTLLALGLAGAFVAGLLGVGGAIIMIPLLLYVPPLLGVGALSVKTVAAVTMVQVFVAAVSGMLAHRRYRAVDTEVALVGGLVMAAGSLAGAILSHYVHERWLLLVFALMVTAAGVLLLVPTDRVTPSPPAGPHRFSRRRTALVTGGVGLAAGLVGAGGAFLLVPLLLVVVQIPIRVTIGSSLAITAMAAVAGVAGKLVTGQIPYDTAAVVAVAAVPGARVGAAVSRRLSGGQLKAVLGVTILVIAVRVWWHVLLP